MDRVAIVKPLEDIPASDVLEGDLMDILDMEDTRAEKLSPGTVGTPLCSVVLADSVGQLSSSTFYSQAQGLNCA